MKRAVIEPEPYWLIALGLAIGDQLTKALVRPLDHPIEVANVISFGPVLNREGVFGLNISNEALIAISIVVAIGLIWLLAGRLYRPPARLGAWLILAGALSNLIDRVVAGGVIDIIGIGTLPRFNIADVMIVLGALSLLRGTWWRET